MIEKLTPEQEALIPVIRDKWLNKLFSLPKIDRPKCVEGTKWLYKYCELEEPDVVFVESPMAAQIAANILCNEDKVWADYREDDDLLKVIGDNHRTKINNIIDEQMTKYLNGKLSKQDLKYYESCSYGDISDYGWLSFFDYFNEIGVKFNNQEEFLKYKEYIETGIFYNIQLSRTCILCEMPKYIHRDPQNRLHDTSGPAIEFYDGYKLYFLNGISMEKEIVLTPPEQMKTEWVLDESNAEKRMVIYKKMGGENFAKKAELTTIDEISGEKLYKKFPIGNYYQQGDVLIKPAEKINKVNWDDINIEMKEKIKNVHYKVVELPQLSIRYLCMTNPSTANEHIEEIPNTCKTVFEAIKFRNECEYLPCELR